MDMKRLLNLIYSFCPIVQAEFTFTYWPMSAAWIAKNQLTTFTSLNGYGISMLLDLKSRRILCGGRRGLFRWKKEFVGINDEFEGDIFAQRGGPGRKAWGWLRCRVERWLRWGGCVLLFDVFFVAYLVRRWRSGQGFRWAPVGDIVAYQLGIGYDDKDKIAGFDLGGAQFDISHHPHHAIDHYDITNSYVAPQWEGIKPARRSEKVFCSPKPRPTSRLAEPRTTADNFETKGLKNE